MAYGLLIKWYLRFAWVLGIHPISFGFPEVCNHKRWRLTSMRLHQIYCGLVCVLLFFAKIKAARLIFNYPVDNPLVFFWAARFLIYLWVHVFYKSTGYRKHRQLKGVLNFLEGSSPKWCSPQYSKWMVKLVAIALGILALASGPLLYGVTKVVQFNTTLSAQMKINAEEMKWTLFLINQPTVTSIDSSNAVSADDVAFGVFNILLYIVAYLHFTFLVYFMFAAVGSMWIATRGYCKYFKNCVQIRSDTETKPKVLSMVHELIMYRGNITSINFGKLRGEFLEFKEFFNQCNEIIGSLILLFIAESILVNTTNLNWILHFKGYLKQHSVLYDDLLRIGVLWMSADIHKQINNLCTVIYDEMETCDNNRQDDFETLLNVMERNKLGVSVWGCFNLTYSGVFQIVGATLTFYLLVVGKKLEEFAPNKKT